VNPVLIGYFPKHSLQRPDWLLNAGVEEICSVSCCIAKGAEGWIDLWRHNECSVFSTQELAWSVVPAEKRAGFELYAYKVFPLRFEHGAQIDIQIPTLHIEPLPQSFMRIGYDVASRSCTPMFECSPLSCNGLAEDHAVNRYCLVDTEETALQLARECSISDPEPGDYYVIEVWRAAITTPCP
jgi:hypothetical protein